jgi:ABC-type multidrug transport system fused ATPase/permease subunit
MKDKTRILVTHHLEVAQHADFILVMDQGHIIQQGNYEALKKTAGTFQTLIEEYGNAKKEDADILEAIDDRVDGKQAISQEPQRSGMNGKTTNTMDTDEKTVTKIHVDEELLTGAISGKTFMAYLKAMSKGGPLVMALSGAVLTECVAIALTLILGFWATSSISGFGQSQYMGLYAGLGVAVAVFSFVGTYSTYLCGIGASFLMAQQALNAVLRSPVSFHDRTPSGRIISRLTKDIETMDDRLSNHIYWVLGGILSIMGTIGLVFYTFPYLGLVFIPMFAVYYLIGVIYARAARQVRRINSTMRSYVYSAFGEQLSGVVSIRAYQQQQAFSDKFSAALDNEGRFYYVIIFSNIWLALRLDLLGSILILGIGIFGVCFRNDVSPAKLSVVLTYSLQTTQVSYLVLHHFRSFMFN